MENWTKLSVLYLETLANRCEFDYALQYFTSGLMQEYKLETPILYYFFHTVLNAK